MQFHELILSIRHLDTSLRKGVSSVANCALTVRNWVIGAWIVEFEQDGADRATYGEKLVPELAKNLSLPGLGASSLWACRQFFLQYPAILQTLSEESLTHTPQLLPILQTLSEESSGAPSIQLDQLRALAGKRAASRPSACCSAPTKTTPSEAWTNDSSFPPIASNFPKNPNSKPSSAPNPSALASEHPPHARRPPPIPRLLPRRAPHPHQRTAYSLQRRQFLQQLPKAAPIQNQQSSIRRIWHYLSLTRKASPS